VSTSMMHTVYSVHRIDVDNYVVNPHQQSPVLSSQSLS
jgi:hypothetical protein